jgi:hypothetical protein
MLGTQRTFVRYMQNKKNENIKLIFYTGATAGKNGDIIEITDIRTSKKKYCFK